MCVCDSSRAHPCQHTEWGSASLTQRNSGESQNPAALKSSGCCPSEQGSQTCPSTMCLSAFSGPYSLTWGSPGPCSSREITASTWPVPSGTEDCCSGNCSVQTSWKCCQIAHSASAPERGHFSSPGVIPQWLIECEREDIPCVRNRVERVGSWLRASRTAEVTDLSSDQSWHQRPLLNWFSVSAVWHLFCPCAKRYHFPQCFPCSSTVWQCAFSSRSLFVWAHNTGLRAPVRCHADPSSPVPSVQRSRKAEASAGRPVFLFCQNVIAAGLGVFQQHK